MNDTLRQAADPEIQAKQCVVELLIQIDVGLFKIQLAGPVIYPVLESGEVIADDFGKWKVEKIRKPSGPSIVLMG